MLSDLSVSASSARRQRRLRPKLDVCLRRRVRSGEIKRRPGPKSNAGGCEERLTYDLFTSTWLLTANQRVCARFTGRRQRSANTHPC